ncbi:phage tail protein [Occallatibacter riparius]|uniref:Tail fiber protein n=1 Tax=Occallatibacter riparius TaxID=1002689 RepID=A0A9J7BY68_9BACT|nr:tail fiber protein [Occallatibacter riparius]UWZ86118.1 tail fiber protein [Occallatibacter riparius]
MSTPYVGEIRMFAGNFAPVGWAFCAGQLVPISENDVLFQLIGTTYGGDGQETFALPNLQSRVPMHQGSGFVLGQAAGSENVTLTSQQMPVHGHTATATTGGNTAGQPGGNYLAQGADIYETNTAGNAAMSPSLTTAGGSQPHSNIQPFLCVNFIISLYGIFPSQS